LQDVLGESRLQVADNVLGLVLGSGQTIGLRIQQGQVTLAQSFHVGALRTHELLVADGGTGDRLRNLLRAHGDELVEQLMQASPLEQVSMLVVMGSGARFAAEEAAISEAKNEASANPWVTKVSPAKIMELADELAPVPVERLVRKMRMTFQDAETVAPALMSMAQVLRATKADEVLVVNTHIRDRLLKEMSMRGRDSSSILFEEQVVYAAHNLATRYEADDVHAKNVAAISMMLFDELKEEHALGPHERIMLRCASILHDIGAFVNPRGHHKHSMYLIQNSSIFGLSGADMPLVALTARYHRKTTPSAAHPEFTRLGRRERTVVIKMAALLRVADALECTHQPLLRRMEFQREGDRLVILIHNTEDLSMERLALREKGDLFSEVFGITIDLREARAEELSFGRT